MVSLKVYLLITGTNNNGKLIKQYSEKKKVWIKGEVCQTGFAPSSDECQAFNHLVLEKKGNEEVCTLIK